MYDVLRKPYEVSLWDDVPAWVVLLEGETTPVEYVGSYVGARPVVGNQYNGKEIIAVKQYLKEEKICVIGANDMEAQGRIVNPNLTTNVNAATTFTFTMYYQYEDWRTSEHTINPYWDFIVNERKLKLKYDGKWYDFVIKSIKEDSDKKSIDVTAKDLAVVELSKTGFNIEFDEQLGNNLDNAGTLVGRIIEGTDWKYDSPRSDKFWQTRDETVYVGKLGENWNTLSNGKGTTKTFEVFSIEKESGTYTAADPHGEVSEITDGNEIDPNEFVGGYIFVFYSCAAGRTPFYQFLLCKEGDKIEQDENLVITNLKNYYINLEEGDEGVKVVRSEYLDSRGLPNNDNIDWGIGPKGAEPQNLVSSEFMGRRQVRTHKGCFDAGLDRYVYEYHRDDISDGDNFKFDLVDIDNLASRYINAESTRASSWRIVDGNRHETETVGLECKFDENSRYKHNTIFIPRDAISFFKYGYQIEYTVDPKYIGTGIEIAAWDESGKNRLLRYGGELAPGQSKIVFGAEDIYNQLNENGYTINDIATIRFYFNHKEDQADKKTNDTLTCTRTYINSELEEVDTPIEIKFLYDKSFVENHKDFFYRRGYTSSDYVTKELAVNFISNPEDFSCGDPTSDNADSNSYADGWTSPAKGQKMAITRENKDVTLNGTTYTGKIGLKMAFKPNTIVYNSALYSNAARIGPLTKGERYVFDWACTGESIRNEPSGDPYTPAGHHTMYLAYFTINSNGEYVIKKVVGSVSNDMSGADEGESGDINNTDTAYIYFINLNGKKYKRYGRILTISQSVPEEDLSNGRVGLFIKGFSDNTIVMFQCRFFKYIPVTGCVVHTYGGTKKLPFLDPDYLYGEESSEYLDNLSEVVTRYNYYDPAQRKDYDENTIVYEYSEYVDSIHYLPRYTYEKVRSITAKESNRFNIIQSICETFECWSKFEIDHDAVGRVLTTYSKTGDKNIDISYGKRVILREYIGKENDVGFRYGINLKSIQRTIDSESIATKVIVKPNANEHALNGSCMITRAYSNPIGENYILNFDHYINKGLLNREELINDFYVLNDTEGYLGLYARLITLNKDNAEMVKRQNDATRALLKAQADYTTYDLAQREAADNFEEAATYYTKITGKVFPAHASKETQEQKDAWNEAQYFKVQEGTARGKLDPLKAEIDTYNNTIFEVNKRIEENAAQKRELDQAFERKYGRYIQEGSWISEDYMDDELYYFDAVSTAHTSANPKITYTINVLELSQLERYSDYTFDLGDKSYIEDVDFFGYCRDGSMRPYHEEVIVSEVKINLDSPESNQLKIQNYKTQFDDLFQRVAASTQTVEFKGGQYARAANALTTDGTIKESALVGVLADGSLTIGDVNTDTVIWGPDGITVRAPATNLTNKCVKIRGDGIYLYVDGGSATPDLKIGADGLTGNLKVNGWLQIGKYIRLQGSSLMLGEEAGVHSTLTSESLKFFEGNSDWFSLKSGELRLGPENGSNTTIKNDGITLKDGTTSLQLNSDRILMKKGEVTWFNVSGNASDTVRLILNEVFTIQTANDTDEGSTSPVDFPASLTTAENLLIKMTKRGANNSHPAQLRIKATGENSVMELSAKPQYTTEDYTSHAAIYFTRVAGITNDDRTEHTMIQFSVRDPYAYESYKKGVNYYFTSKGIYAGFGSTIRRVWNWNSADAPEI